MSSRKDLLRNLGIPEYPWSSDDDDPPTDSQPSSNSQPRSTGQQAAPSSSSPSGTPGRSQAPSRDLFLSIINRAGRSVPVTATPITGSNRLFRSDLPLYLSRTTHTPAPELRERADTRDDSDIQHVLAFKRLTRNISHGIGRYSRFSSYSIPRIPSVRIPGAAEPPPMPYQNWRAPNRTSATNNTPRSARSVVDAAESGREGGTPSRRRRTLSMEVHNSEDEPDEHASSARAPVPAAPPLPVDAVEPAIEQETDADNQASSNNTSGTSLEEDVVEIVDVEPPTVDLDLIELPRSIDPARSVHNLAEISPADEADAPELETPQRQGVKRKRRASSEDKPADLFTVKEFNQSLLRLLECPVCLEWMEPPMSQCRRGHLVCNRCRARLASCPVCRTTFSSVRNRAMEGVAEMLRYPCRHGCGREVRLRRRAPHEASCSSRKYMCPAPLCADKLPLPREQLASHFHSKHLHLVKLGCRHRFGLKVNAEAHDNWLIMALDEFFHVKVDVDIRTWGVIVYVAYIGPQCNAKEFAYEVSIDGQHNGRKMVYRRATHSDLESSSLNVSRQDCFHLTLDQALNFIRYKNRHCDAERFLEFDVELSKIEPPPVRDESDS